MSALSIDSEAVRRLITEMILGPDFLRATFGGAVRGTSPAPWVRVVVRPVILRGTRHLQFSYFDEKKCFTKNYTGPEVAPRLGEVVDAGFAGIHLSTRAEEIDVRTSKKGKIAVGRRPVNRPADAGEDSHNRVKDLPLPEGRADRLLEALGISTREGRVRPTMRAKYTQVNEFLKLLEHVLDDAGLRSLGRPVEILDCGCGSSHLTLAAHHYLNDVLGIAARITGVDVNEELIRKSADRAARLGNGGVAFACGPISSVDAKPDVVLALHACDTATDDAIAAGVRLGAEAIVVAPCCHHELADQLAGRGKDALLRHGLLLGRQADLVTDALRAAALETAGYRVDVIEFVAAEHTAKNVMLRAVRAPSPQRAARAAAEYAELRDRYGVDPAIGRLLDVTGSR